jgi:hypothetical protein
LNVTLQTAADKHFFPRFITPSWYLPGKQAGAAF